MAGSNFAAALPAAGEAFKLTGRVSGELLSWSAALSRGSLDGDLLLDRAVLPNTLSGRARLEGDGCRGLYDVDGEMRLTPE